MVDRVRVHIVATWRLQRHKNVAELQASQRQRVVMDKRAAGRLAPLRDHFSLARGGHIREPGGVAIDGHAQGAGKLRLSQPRTVVGAAVDQIEQQLIAASGQFTDCVALGAHRAEQAHE